MGTYNFDDNANEKKQLPAGQRGIGCALIILLPIFSYVAAIELLRIPDVRRFFYRVSPALFGAPNIPSLFWEITAIKPFLRTVSSWTNLEANLLLGVVVLILLSAVFSLIYSFAYRAVAPSRYGGHDVPPPKRKSKKYKR